MIHPAHFYNYIILPSLKLTGTWCESSENLLLGIAAQETEMSTFLAQRFITFGKGGIGPYQMERKTHDDTWSHLPKRHRETIMAACGMTMSANADRMLWDLRYSTLMCRFFFMRFKEPLPEKDDINGLAHYWKNHWNTQEGSGTTEQFIENYKRYVRRFKNASL